MVAEKRLCFVPPGATPRWSASAGMHVLPWGRAKKTQPPTKEQTYRVGFADTYGATGRASPHARTDARSCGKGNLKRGCSGYGVSHVRMRTMARTQLRVYY